MAILSELPSDVVLELFTHFPLKTLIAARGVSRTWRTFVEESDINPIRRALLHFYLRIVHSPWFLVSRKWVAENNRSFDREDYMRTLRQYGPGCHIPEDFAMWILEWPARAVIRCQWPGLPDTLCRVPCNPLTRCIGYNCLGTLPPTVRVVTYSEYVNDEDENDDEQLFIDVPALAIWEEPRDVKIWLLLDGSDRFRGQILSTSADFNEFEGDKYHTNQFYNYKKNWLDYLEYQIGQADCVYEIHADYVERPASFYEPGPLALDFDSERIVGREWSKISDTEG
ncbi:hypothetical protein HGRIS_006854 [Hohenbuehelia grisea]|uniref:F-box domain-containing protein n=1 Tax=Hohenbuehelia grisea TaxID=104357 RepID=A0ABR3JAD3_9AGAR